MLRRSRSVEEEMDVTSARSFGWRRDYADHCAADATETSFALWEASERASPAYSAFGNGDHHARPLG